MTGFPTELCNIMKEADDVEIAQESTTSETKKIV